MNGFKLSERYVTLINLLIGLVVIPYFLALSVSDVVKLRYAGAVLPAASELPPSAREAGGRHSRRFYDVIVRRDIFNLVPPTVETAPVANESLDVTLIGTSQVTTGKPFAIVESAGTQAVYQVGETIPGAGELLSVGADRVMILHNGRRVALALPHQDLAPGPSVGLVRGRGRRGQRAPRPARAPRATPAAPETVGPGIHQLGPNRYVLDRSTVDSNMKNMAALFTQMRAVPKIDNGVATGFQLSEIQPNSVFQEIGLQNGDLVKAINGQPIGDPAKAFALVQSLQDQTLITVNVVRNGTPQLIYYKIH